MKLGLGDKWELLKLYRRRKQVFAKLSSRKLWAAVISAAIVALGSQLGLDDVTTAKIAAIAVGYMVSQSYVDGASAKNGGSK